MTINVYSLDEPVKRCIERSERFDISHSPFLAQHIGFLGFRLPSGSLGGGMGRNIEAKMKADRDRGNKSIVVSMHNMQNFFDESNGAI